MAARGDEVAPASAQEQPAAAELGLILLYVGGCSVKTLGRFHLRGVTPLSTLPRHADAHRGPAHLTRGLYFAVTQGSDTEILDLAILSFMEGLPLLVGGKEKEERKKTRDAKLEKEEEEEAKEVDTVLKEAKEGDAGLEEEEEMEQVEEAGMNVLSIRLWPGNGRATLVLYHGGKWKLTRTYHIKWLEVSMKEEVVKLMNKDPNGAVTYKTATFSAWTSREICRMEFEGSLIYVTDSMNLNPDLNQFEGQELLGKGADGSVFKCTLMDTEYALKVVTSNTDANEPREVHLMSCLEDPNVVVFYQAWSGNKNVKYPLEQTKDGLNNPVLPNAVFIHMELCSSSLMDVLSHGNSHIPMHTKWAILKKITQGVKYLLQNGVLHRDLKPENILIGQNNAVKISDFGHACWIENYMDSKKCTPNRGTVLYRAPELNKSELNEKVDVYSIGVMSLEIIPQFDDRIQSTFAMFSFMSQDYKDTEWDMDMKFLKAATANDPSDRYSVDELLEYIVNQCEEGADGAELDITSLTL